MSINVLFSCALLVLNPCGLATQNPTAFKEPQSSSRHFHLLKIQAKKAYVEAALLISSFKLYAQYSYDANTLLDKIILTSILTHPQAGLLVTGSLDDPPTNLDDRKSIDVLPKKKNIYANNPGYDAMRQARTVGSVSFYTLIKEQYSLNNPNDSVKIESSDIYASTYYPERRFSANQGYILNLEARINLPELVESQSSLMQLIVFVDTGDITMDQYTLANGLSHNTISGAGLGLNWTYVDHLEVKAYFANQLDYQVLAIAPALSSLFWMQAVKYF